MGKIKFKIMSYNVQCFDYINNQTAVQTKIFDKNNAQIVGIQELSTSRNIKPAGQFALAQYPHKYFSAHKAFLGFASKEKLVNIKNRDFRYQDPEDMRLYNQTRAYMMADYIVDGKTITIINAHLAFQTQHIKFKQMQELFDLMRTMKYAILLGDFNCFMVNKGDTEYVNMYKQFADNGFHLANCVDGITKTWTDKKAPKSLSDFTYPTDNIITTPAVSIKKVYFDKTKLSYPNGYDMDHIPVIALVEIK